MTEQVFINEDQGNDNNNKGHNMRFFGRDISSSNVFVAASALVGISLFVTAVAGQEQDSNAERQFIYDAMGRLVGNTADSAMNTLTLACECGEFLIDKATTILADTALQRFAAINTPLCEEFCDNVLRFNNHM